MQTCAQLDVVRRMARALTLGGTQHSRPRDVTHERMCTRHLKRTTKNMQEHAQVRNKFAFNVKNRPARTYSFSLLGIFSSVSRRGKKLSRDV